MSSHDDHLHRNILDRAKARARAERINAAAQTDNGVACLRNFVRVANDEKFGAFVSDFVVSTRMLMIHNCGHMLVLDVLRRCDAVQIEKIVDFVCGDERKLKTICLNFHGCEALEILIRKYLMPGAKSPSKILAALRPITIDLVQNYIGQHIISTCMRLFSPRDTRHIALEIASCCSDLAIDKIGCKIIQTCLENANVVRNCILNYVGQNAFELSSHPYGNYVVQRALELRNSIATSNIVAGLEKKFVTLSMDKFGSNVVEKCLKVCDPLQVGHIIVEIVNDPYFPEFLQDQYGNYVAQSAIKKSRGIARALNMYLVKDVVKYSHLLRGQVFGSKVLAMAMAMDK